MKILRLITCFLTVFISFQSMAGYSSWMYDNKASIGNIPLIQLAIPGSHDSATSNISKQSKYSAELGIPEWVHEVGQALPFVPLDKVIAKWSKAQTLSVWEQLNEGIRYLDLRVCYDKDSGDLYTCHGMLSTKLSVVLDEISSFSKSNPNELIIINFQEFYAMTEEAEFQIKTMIDEKLGTKMVPRAYHLSVTPNDLWQTPYRFITFYGDDDIQKDNPLLWSISDIYDPWANTPSMDTLERSLETYINQQDGQHFFVLQAIRTPNAEAIIKALLSSKHSATPHSLHEMANITNPLILNKVRGDWSNKSLNIIIMDWIENSELTKAAIEYNKSKPIPKLLGNASFMLQSFSSMRR